MDSREKSPWGRMLAAGLALDTHRPEELSRSYDNRGSEGIECLVSSVECTKTPRPHRRASSQELDRSALNVCDTSVSAGNTSHMALAASTLLPQPHNSAQSAWDRTRVLSALLDQWEQSFRFLPLRKLESIGNNRYRTSEYVRSCSDSLLQQYIYRSKSNCPVLIQTSSCSRAWMGTPPEELRGKKGTRLRRKLAQSPSDIRSEPAALLSHNTAGSDSHLWNLYPEDT